jgi:hypothetical protein
MMINCKQTHLKVALTVVERAERKVVELAAR